MNLAKGYLSIRRLTIDLTVAMFLGVGCMLLAFNAYATDVRVALFQKHLPNSVVVSSTSGLKLHDPQTRQLLGEVKPNQAVTFTHDAQGVRVSLPNTREQIVNACWVTPQDATAGLQIRHAQLPDPRPYAGSIEIQREKKWLLVVNHVPEKDYLAAVVSAEMPADWPLEAIKSQAVVTRTYMVKFSDRHVSQGYAFCDLTHCQVYQGKKKVTARVLQAVQETEGQILLYEQQPIEACFHACCGGHTVAAREAWPGSPDKPCLQSQPDQGEKADYCAEAPDYQWSVLLPKEKINLVYPGARHLAIKQRHPSGHVASISLGAMPKDQVLSGEDFYLAWGRTYDWLQIKSTWFEIMLRENGYLLQGHGLGHGVGMCQWGARGRALAGKNYREILQHYFPGTQVVRAEPML